MNELPFLSTVAWRVVPAALLLWIYVWLRGLSVPRTHEVWVGFLGMGLLNNVIPFGLMAWGQQFIETGLTSILNAATAIFGVLVAALFFADERLTLRKTLGVGLGFFGVSVAIGLSSFATLDLRSLAQLAVIGGTVSYALASVWARVRLGALPPQVAAAGMLTGSSLIMLPLALWVDGPQVPMQPETWAAVAYYSILGTATAYLLYYRVLGMAGSGNTMLCTLMIPPVAIVLGAWVLGEALLPQAYLGFALLAGGLAVLDGRVWTWVKARRAN